MLSIGNDRLSLSISPDYGARVLSLTDRNSGRQWLVTGPQSSYPGEGTAYGADEAVGWDECFPTVLSCDHPAWGGRLRDHGVLWGRHWSVDLIAPECVETRFETSLFRFTRRLTVAGAAAVANYRVSNLGPRQLPYLWSQHCLLATSRGDRIFLAGHERLRIGEDPFVWPTYQGRDLSIVGPPDEGVALKAYSETPRRASATIVGPNGGITLDWDDVPAFGLWLCYGGWPKGNPVNQVALEPTTAAVDNLADADTLGQARMLGLNEMHSWSVRMTLTDRDDRIRR